LKEETEKMILDTLDSEIPAFVLGMIAEINKNGSIDAILDECKNTTERRRRYMAIVDYIYGLAESGK